jgi:hypothetical protein
VNAEDAENEDECTREVEENLPVIWYGRLGRVNSRTIWLEQKVMGDLPQFSNTVAIGFTVAWERIGTE